jgi:3-oxoacyl-(acyl-carrier-protein) synthase
MTPLAPAASPGLAALRAAAAAAGLTVTSAAAWPETDADTEAPALAGFIASSFSPLLAEAATRALRRRDGTPAGGTVTAVVMVTALGDVTSAARVAEAVDAGKRVSPLMFFQSVPNAVAGYLAARWHLTGPVACVSTTGAGLEAAALLIEDADADEALVVRVDLAVTDGDRDYAAAILVTGPVVTSPVVTDTVGRAGSRTGQT